MNLRLVLCCSILLVLASCKKDSTEATTNDPLDNGMIAFYPFNGNANDHSGNNYHLTVKGATPTADRFGKSANAYSFNGTGALMTIPKFNNADSIDNFTISLWVKSKIENSQVYLLSLSGTSISSNYAHSIQLFENTNNYQLWTEFVRCQPASALCSITYANLPIPDIADEWTHIVVGQNNSNPVTYINGQEVFNAALHYAPISFGNGGTIGSKISGVSNFFKGDLDDIRIYNRLLSREEIQELSNDKP